MTVGFDNGQPASPVAAPPAGTEIGPEPRGGVTPLRSALTVRGRVLLVGAAVLIGVGIWLRYPELTALGGAAIVADIVALLAVVRTPALDTKRSVFPHSVQRGANATATVQVTNTSRWRLPRMQAWDVAGPGREPFRVPALKAAEPYEGTTRLPTRRRGLIVSGPLLVDRADVLGLAFRSLDTGLIDTLYVQPKAVTVTMPASSMARSADGPQSETTVQGTLAFHSLREYVPGDEPRHVDWKATAHAGGRLLVKQHVDTSLAGVAVVLDVALPKPDAESANGIVLGLGLGSGPASYAEAFETSVDCAASLACAAATASHPLTLVDGHGRDLLSSGGGGRRTGHTKDAILDALTPITAEDGRDTRDEELSVLLRSLAGRSKGSLAALVTTRSPEPWALALQSLAAAYARVTVVHAVRQGEPVPAPRQAGRISWLTVSYVDSLPTALHRAWAA
jgi:uncharacterized protein (DUF58 family)